MLQTDFCDQVSETFTSELVYATDHRNDAFTAEFKKKNIHLSQKIKFKKKQHSCFSSFIS